MVQFWNRSLEGGAILRDCAVVIFSDRIHGSCRRDGSTLLYHVDDYLKLVMHAAVWSQPIVCRKVHRCHSRAETPHSRLGKLVFCIGIGLSLFGGILSVLGLTGYFARGDTKYCLAFGGIVGLSSMFAGVIGIRAVSRKSKARRSTLAFMFLSIATWASAVAMVVLGSKVLQIRPEHLLTTILAAAETTISALISVVAGVGFFIAVKFRCQLMYPERSDDEENVDKDVPVLPQEIKSPQHE